MEYKVEKSSREGVKDFIEKWHYSKSINGISSSYCFKLLDGETLIGAMIFGRMAMVNQWRKYGADESKIIELRRLVLIDDTKRNAESFFIGRSLRWLKQNTDIEVVVSYADPEYGHTGVIYKASNFKMVGRSAKGRVIIWNNKKYHDKCIRTYYKGKLKPFALRVRESLENGEAKFKKTEGKYIYVYRLKN